MNNTFQNLNVPEGLSARLTDLNQFGISLNNRPFVCVVCSGTIRKQYDDHARIDGTCCIRCSGELEKKNPYNSDTVWVVKVLNPNVVRVSYDVIVKIDGTLYYGNYLFGSSYVLFNLETGEEVRRGSLHISPHSMMLLHKKQTNKTVQTYVLQLRLLDLVEKLHLELHYRANWAKVTALYEVTQSSDYGYRSGWIRLYMQPSERNVKDFEVVAVEVVKDGNADFLPEFSVMRLPNGVANLRWSQAGMLIMKAIQDMQIQRVALEVAYNASELFTRRNSLPSEAWINLVLDWYDYTRPTHNIAHELEHLNIFTV